MKNNIQRRGVLYVCLFLFCASSLSVIAQDIVSGEDMDKWLEMHAVESTELSDSVKKEDERPVVRARKVKRRSKKGGMPERVSAKELLAQIDEEENASQASLLAKENPMFMDMVFQYPQSTVSLSLTDKDSTIQRLRADVKRDIRLYNTELFALHYDELPSIDDILNVGTSARSIKRVKVDMAKSEKVNIDLPEDPLWSYGGNFSVQVSQNYISSNWYKGGESNLAGIVDAVGFVNYNNRKNIEWENKAEWDLGFNSAGSDTLRQYRVNQDMFRLTTKLGVKAFKSFYYTAEGEFTTQFCNNYVTNSYERVTAPFSPIRTDVSLGLDYKYKKMLSVFISPISYKFVYVGDTTVGEGVDPTLNIARKFGVAEGHKALHQLGGLLKVTFKHTFVDMIGLESNFSLYTNYVGSKMGVEIDWEITANFLINRFFSAKVTLHPRYDNIVILPGGEAPEIQLNELISVGFNYKI